MLAIAAFMLVTGCVSTKRARVMADTSYSVGYIAASQECFPQLLEKSKRLQEVESEIQVLRDKYDKCGGWIKRGQE